MFFTRLSVAITGLFHHQNLRLQQVSVVIMYTLYQDAPASSWQQVAHLYHKP
jgi:hypothetical protein